MRFFAPKILWMSLPLWALLPAIWYALEKRAAERFASFSSPALLPRLLRGASLEAIHGRRRTRFIVGYFALLFAILALARPQLGMREETLPSEGLDIAFLLDVSNSMLAEDVVPSRMKKAKHVIKNFVDRFSGDRAGLVAFAGSAYPAVPLTTDYDFLKQNLEVVDESSIANQGSDLAKGLKVAMDLLERGGLNGEEDAASQGEESSSASRVIVVLSDGESTIGTESELVPKLKEAGVRVYTIGVGTSKGSPIPIRDQTGYMRGYKRDSGGNMVLTKLETGNLEALASKTGGKFYSASSNEGEVEEILSQVSSMERAQGAGRRVIVYDEVFQYPLAAAVLLMLVMLALREARRPLKFFAASVGEDAGKIEGQKEAIAAFPSDARALAIAIMAAGAALLQARETWAAQSLREYGSTKKGIEAYQQKDYAEAIQQFGKAQASNPESDINHLNLGDALLRSGSAEGAIPEFEAMLKSGDSTAAGKGAYNLGKAFEQAKDFDKAMAAYQVGLERLVADPKSDTEVELRIKRALEQALQKKQQQQKQQQQQNGQGQQSQANGKDDQKDQKDKQEQANNKQYQIPKRKPEFKPEKLSEADAKRILKQLKEQEQKSQQRVMRSKTGRPKEDRNIKDW